jgi:hypothetical protein
LSGSESRDSRGHGRASDFAAFNPGYACGRGAFDRYWRESGLVVLAVSLVGHDPKPTSLGLVNQRYLSNRCSFDHLDTSGQRGHLASFESGATSLQL